MLRFSPGTADGPDSVPSWPDRVLCSALDVERKLPGGRPFDWANVTAFSVGGEDLKWSDLLGNTFVLATVAFALRRSIWAWPVQITACTLLFGASMSAHLGGNAARQVVLAAAAIYGWRAWTQKREKTSNKQLVS